MRMPILALALVLTLAGCMPDSEAAAPIPGAYTLIAVEGLEVSGTPSLHIAEDGTVSGQGPCNLFTGRNKAALPALDLGALATTRRACLQEGGEHAFFQALGAVREARREGGELVMTGPGVTIRWRAATR
ncbi:MULTISPECIES: META domain-containing protein [unclassified Paracoccus (in: a-proteobacteria)]|uniref:META domain-containing protein n=1 Tax=unclassified Paracoccus (in: a-proteobacteria) TaxID=2688777 RepID=UPI0004B7BD5B|nr:MULTISPECIES: META domain-containing protein [unclassified Paracoccus (in: a-proteobacteria)]